VVVDGADEPALVRRCRDGDQAAFAVLVERYRDLVFGLAYRMTRDPRDAEDLAQDAFLRLYRGLPYFRGDAKLSTWIYRIVLNVAQERNDKKRVPVVELDAHSPGRTPVQYGRPDEQFNALELQDRLRKAMARLSPRSRFVLAAHYLHDMQYDSVAEALGVPMGTVKTLIHRAKRQLRDLLVSGGL
jgi:RNA polymerase sigma-70 factor (ECF subfamily)